MGVGEKGLSDAHGQTNDVLVFLDEAQRGELLQQRVVVTHPSCVVPRLEMHAHFKPAALCGALLRGHRDYSPALQWRESEAVYDDPIATRS